MIGTLIGALFAFAIASPSSAQAAVLASLPSSNNVAVVKPPQKRKLENVGIKTLARSAFVADVATGQVLYAKDPHRVLPIASLTKLVTAMTFLDTKPDLAQTVTIEESDIDTQSRPEFAPGDIVTKGDLLKAMLVGSVNTAANAIARSTGGTEKFVEAMNRKVKDLDLRSPRYVDPSGLDEANRANAADVAAILSTALNYPEIRDITHLSDVTITTAAKKEVKLNSTNLLLSSFLNQKPYGIVAAKTGSLPQSGYCMAQVTKNEGGHQIVAVELGSENTFSRFQDIKALTAWTFESYQWP